MRVAPCFAALLVLTLSLWPAVAAAKAAPKNGDAFGDWTYVCDKDANGKMTACEIAQTQTMNDANGKEGRLLRLSIAKKEGTYLMHALLPLGLHLPSGVEVKVDDNEQKAMTPLRCTVSGCEAILKVDNAFSSQMKKGKELRIGFNVGAKTVVIPASLKGFTGAIGSLE